MQAQHLSDAVESWVISARLLRNFMMASSRGLPLDEFEIPNDFFNMINDPFGKHIISCGARGRMDWNIDATKNITVANGQYLLFKYAEALEIDEYIMRRKYHDRYLFRDFLWHDCEFDDGEEDGCASVIENGAIFERKIALCRNCLDLSAVKKACRCQYKIANLGFSRHAHYDILSQDIFEVCKKPRCATSRTCKTSINSWFQQQYVRRVKENTHWYSITTNRNGVTLSVPFFYATTLRSFSVLSRHLIRYVLQIYYDCQQSLSLHSGRYLMVYCIICLFFSLSLFFMLVKL